MRHFISVDQLTEKDIYSMIQRAESYRNQKMKDLTRQLFTANLFFEPSTRTKMSFIVAQRKMGFEALDFHEDTSSVRKGESLYDKAKSFEAIGGEQQ